MEVGNPEKRSSSKGCALREQREKDLERRACFTCHKVGCRLWKHCFHEINNVDVLDTSDEEPSDATYDSDSESEN